MKRIFEMQSILAELQEYDESTLLSFQQFNDFTEDVLRKLIHIRASLPVFHPEESRRAHSSNSFGWSSGTSDSGGGPSSPRSMRSLPSPNSSADSGCSSSFWPSQDVRSRSRSSCSHSLRAAQAAFDRQIYSRCVQIVEGMLKQLASNGGKETYEHHKERREAIQLAHSSYEHMVCEKQAEEEEEVYVETNKKLTRYWVSFIRSVYLPHLPPDARLELLDFHCDALAYRAAFEYDMEEEGRELLWEEQIEAATECFKIALLAYRPFHLHSLRRLQRLSQILKESERLEGKEKFDDAFVLLTKEVKRANRDRVKYEEETGAEEESVRVDTDYILSRDILSLLLADIAVNSGKNSPSSFSDTEEIVDKIFVEDMVIRL